MLNIQENVLLAPLTTFQIGGTVRYFADVRSENDIKEAVLWARDRGVRLVVISGGSNLLVPDSGLDALVMRLVGNLYSMSKGKIDAWSGTNLFFLIRAAGVLGFGGWEKLAGIPGTIGGAVRGNAGAFGPEIKNFTTHVRALNVATGEVREFQNHECDFSYRHSFFKDYPEWVITRVHVRLQQVGAAESARAAEETIAEREKRHLQNVRAAGSYFMNPVAPPHIVEMFEKEKGVKSRENRVPAGWLIEKAGMKGASVGDAKASDQHPNYIVNTGEATSDDVLELAENIRRAVREKFGVELSEEAAVLS